MRFYKWDIELTEVYFGETIFHPAFWIKHRLKTSLKSTGQHVKGLLLDIGCGLKPYEGLFHTKVTSHVGIEREKAAGYRGNNADLFGDAMFLPIRNECCDTVLCTEVLEHVERPESVLEEIARVLRPDGTAIVTAPFVYPVHDKYDFFRFSAKGLRSISERHGLNTVEVRPLSYPFLTLAIFFAITIHDLCFVRNRYGYLLSLLFRPFLWIVVAALNIMGRVGELLCRSESLPFGYLLVVRKKART